MLHLLTLKILSPRGFPGGLVVTTLRFLCGAGEGMVKHSRTPWTEEPRGLRSIGLHELDITEDPPSLNGKKVPPLLRSPGEGNGNPLQYSCLENPMDGGAWKAAVHGVAEGWT